MIEEKDGYQQVTLENGQQFNITAIDLPDYGTDDEGNSHIFTKAERKNIAAFMIEKWVKYSEAEVDNA